MPELYDALIKELQALIDAEYLSENAAEAAKHFIVAYTEGRVTIIPTAR